MRHTRWARSGGRFWLACVLALSVAGCGDDEESAGIPDRPAGGVELLGSDCDPLVPAFCGLPFPSNVYLEDDPSGLNPSGERVHFGETTLPPRTKDGTHPDPSLFFDHDGFSPSQAPMTHMPRARCSDCATPYDIERSLAEDSPSILLEVPSGRRIPHWVDLDATTPNDGADDRPDQSLLMLRPAELLLPGTRYIVALRNVDDHDGKVITPTKTFAALRDGKLLASGTPAERWSVYARQELYEDIFTQLEGAGVDRRSLQIAWDYTTASKQNITGRMLEMRDKALAIVGDEGPPFTLDKVEEAPTPDLLRRIHVVMTVPLFLTAASKQYDKTKPMDRLNLNDAGELVQNGSMTWDVLILVPKSVETGEKHGLLQNGHGLFGSRFEGQGGYLGRAANRNHWIAFSTNFFGYDGDSVPLAIDALLGQFAALKGFSERQIQGMVNQLLAMRMMIGRVATDGIKDAQGNWLLNPDWIDASVRGYRGDSQGGIMGGTYMSISTDVTYGLLGETGTPYNLLLNRSIDWGGYALMLEGGFGFDAVAMQLVLGATQMGWDRSEPAGFVRYLETDPLPNTPPHHVLMHIARGDHQVTTFGAQIMARAIGAVQLDSDDPSQPVFDDYFGIDRVQAPLVDRSVMVDYDFGLKPNPVTNKPSSDGCDPHDRVRDLGPSYDQQDLFFRTGTIEWFCNGACNCNDVVEGDPKEEERCDETQASQCSK